MTPQKFKTGDVVQLKSGGPSMTVRGYEPVDSDEVVCEWFDQGTRREKAFHQDTIDHYKTFSGEFPIVAGDPYNLYS